MVCVFWSGVSRAGGVHQILGFGHYHHTYLRIRLLVMMIFAVCHSSDAIVPRPFTLKPQTRIQRITLSGLTAHLPCELPLPQDRATLILWYKGQATKPFYSFDARETATGYHKVHDNSDLGKRSHFRLEPLETFPGHYQARLGYLEVENISLVDAGNYTCRVDFVTSQTMMSVITLSVHEDIRDLQVMDADDRNVGHKAGPYKKSSQLYLTCRAQGGYPPPRVQWLSRQEVQATSPPYLEMESLHSVSSGMVAHRKGVGELVTEAILQLTMLKREDNGRTFTCKASNTNLTHPLSRTITIDMWLPPVSVHISGTSAPLQAGHEAELQCRSQGSRPAAQITWKNEGSAVPTIISQSPDMLTSRIRLVPTVEDNGMELSCTATNPEVQGYQTTTKEKLVVHYAPEVSVIIPSTLDPENIKEGDDVYFECKINANPKPSQVVWLHEGSVLHTKRERGLLVHESNLVLQRVNRYSAGKYQCRVTNSIAVTTSAPINLNIMYIPECQEPRNVTVSVTHVDGVKLNCNVDAYPEQVNFSWAVNNSRGMSQLPVVTFTQSGRSSTLILRPQESNSISGDQYGVVYCWGSNALGRMHPACIFNIEPAGPPEEPVSCSLVNHSATSLGVSCIPGHNGGLQQHFLATVQDSRSRETAVTIRSDEPQFSVTGLTSGRDYVVVVTAVNEKGHSQPYVIEGFALKVAENKINDSGIPVASSNAGVFVGMICGFLLIICILVLTTRARCRQRWQNQHCEHDKKIVTEQEALSPSNPQPDIDCLRDSDLQISAEPDIEHLTLNPQDHCHDVPGSSDIEESPASHTMTRYDAMPESWSSSHNGSLPHQYSHILHPSRSLTQPLHSVDLPQVASSNHKYYTLKINCTRQNNESFV